MDVYKLGKGFSIFKRDVVIFVLFAIVVYFGYCLYDVKYFDFMKSECEKNGTCVISGEYEIICRPK